MTAVMRRVSLLTIAALSLTACASGPEQQWYKAGGAYTVAEWERDEKACTVNRVVDESCLKERGWIPISADPGKPPPPPATGSKGTGRY